MKTKVFFVLFIGLLLAMTIASAQEVKTIKQYVIGAKTNINPAPDQASTIQLASQEKAKTEETATTQEMDKTEKPDDQSKKTEGTKEEPISIEEIEKALEGHGEWIDTKEYWYGNYAYWTPMWVDGFDNWYFRTHYDRYYSRSNSRFWTVVRKDQLRNSNLRQVINSTRQNNSINIPNTKLQANIRRTEPLNANASRTLSSQVKAFSSNASVNSPNRTTPPTNKQKYVGGLKDSPWSNDSRVQTNRSTPQSRSRIPIRISGLPFSGQSRVSPQPQGSNRSTSRPSVSRPSTSRPPASRSSVVRSSGASRSSAARTTSSRPASSRGTVARKK